MTGISVEIVEDSGGTDKLARSVSKLRDAIEKTDSSASKAQGSTKSYGSAAAAAANDTNLLSRAAGNAQSGFGMLSGALSSVAAYLSGAKLLGYADTYTEIGNRLRLVTKDQAATNAAMDQSFSIAQKTRTGFEQVAGVYGRVTEALKNVTGTSATAASVTTTVAQAVALSGANADSAKNALTQFQQGLASGTLRGDEFNSVMENTPGLARALAEGLNIPIGRLRSMAEAGELTSARVVNALDKAAPKVAAAFAQSAPTVAQAFTVIENAAMRYVGQTNTAYSVTGILANGMILLANNMAIIAPILGVLVAGLAAIAATSILTTLSSMVGGFLAIAGAAGAAALAIGTTFLVPILAVTAAVGIATLILSKLGVTFSDVTGFLGAFLAKIPGYTELATDIKSTTETWTKANTGLNDTFGALKDNLSGANKAGSGWADTVKKMNANTNQFGEDLGKTGDGQNKLTSATNNGSAAITRYAGATVDGTGAVKNFGGSLDGMRNSVDKTTQSVDELVFAVTEIVGTEDLLQRYGSVGQGAFIKIADAANDAASSVASAQSRIASSTRSAANVNAEIGNYQKNYGASQGGGDAGPASYSVERNGVVVDSRTPITGGGIYGFTYDPGSVAFYRNKLSEGIVAAFDKYKPSASNAEVSAAIAGVQSQTFTSSMADPNTGKMNEGNTRKALADFEALLAATAGKTTEATMAFANGGQFIVRGRPGTDANVTPIHATRGERVTVETPQQQREADRAKAAPTATGRPVTVIIQAKDADSFARSRNQILQDFADDLRRAM